MRTQENVDPARHDAELRDCRECGAQYDLARQNYYGPRCPSCRTEAEA